jgi:hypothetical protein
MKKISDGITNPRAFLKTELPLALRFSGRVGGQAMIENITANFAFQL